MTWFHKHLWTLIDWGHFKTVGGFSPGSDVTLITRECSECGSIKQKELRGYIPRPSVSE